MLSDEVLRTEGLAYSYGKAELWSGVSFGLASGQVAFLEGPNGAGKSTLLRCVAGWDAPTCGEVWLNGELFDGVRRAQRARIAFVPDVPVFYDDLTADEHIRFLLQANRVSASDTRADELMEAFGLAAHGANIPSSFSRGMRQKLALVLAFILKPDLLLFDEPYGPLDRASSIVLSGLVAQACAQGSAALLSCHHDVPQLEPDMLMRLKDGDLRVVERARGCHVE